MTSEPCLSCKCPKPVSGVVFCSTGVLDTQLTLQLCMAGGRRLAGMHEALGQVH